MRTKLLLLSLALLAIASTWLVQRATAARLALQLDVARAEQRELQALQGERDRLRAQQPDADRLANLRRAGIERDRLLREMEARRAVPPPAPFSLGEWTPCHAWKNRGRATPRAAVETALWAAAGGDLPTFASLLELDPAAHTKAQALLDRLPASARHLYPTPEALIASITMNRIPLAEAQIVWFHEADADHAAIGVLLNAPIPSTAGPASDPAACGDQPPPARSDTHQRSLATLSLHRAGADWRLAVPPEAIDRIARDLFAAKDAAAH